MQHSSDIEVRFSVHAAADTYFDDYRCFSKGQIKQKPELLISIMNITHHVFTLHMYVFNSIFKDQYFSKAFIKAFNDCPMIKHTLYSYKKSMEHKCIVHKFYHEIKGKCTSENIFLSTICC